MTMQLMTLEIFRNTDQGIAFNQTKILKISSKTYVSQTIFLYSPLK